MFKCNKAKPIEFPFKGVEVKMSVPEYRLSKNIEISVYDMTPNASITVKVHKSHTTNNKVMKVIYDALGLSETYPLYISRSVMRKLIEDIGLMECDPTAFRNYFNMLFKDSSSNGVILEPHYKLVGYSEDDVHNEISSYNLTFKNEVQKCESVLFHNM